jgi:predicted anti-sigma-YlaC factor YlaD
MTHPEELLTGYVDGALSTQDRAAVESHLASCDHCRQELTLARSAHSALSSLREIPAPAGLVQGAIDEATGIRSISRSRLSVTQRRYQIMALSAAAVVVALLAVTLPHLGEHTTAARSDVPSAQGESAPPNPSVPKLLSLEVQHTDYDSASLQGLATAYKSATFYARDTTGRQPLSSAAPDDVVEAVSCLDAAFPASDFGGRLIRLIRATFGGMPAYLGVYTEGRGANGNPATLSVRVASVDTCTILSLTKTSL